MIKNFYFTQCNSAVSILEHQAQMRERLDRLSEMAKDATGTFSEFEKLDFESGSLYDRTKSKVICATTVVGLSTELNRSLWSKEQLQMISQYLTGVEMALFVYASYNRLEADFVLKYEDEFHNLFDKVAKYLGVVTLAFGAFNGIEYRIGTLDVFKGVRKIEDVELKSDDLNDSFVQIMLFKTKPEVSEYKVKLYERWGIIEEYIGSGDNSMKYAYDLVYDTLGSNPLDVSTADMLVVMRKQLGLTQKEFAERYSIPIGTYNHWEQGVRKPLDYVMHMLYRLVADDLLFADKYDLHSVYSVVAQYLTVYGEGNTPWIILETKDGVTMQNNRLAKLDSFVESQNDEKMKKMLGPETTKWLGDILSRHLLIYEYFSMDEVLADYSDIKVIDSQTMEIKGSKYLKLKLDFTSDDIRAQRSITPHMPESETFDINDNGRYEEGLILGKCVARVADWLIRSMKQSLYMYHFPEKEESLKDIVNNICTHGDRVRHVKPVLMLLTNACYNVVCEEYRDNIEYCIEYLYGKNSDELYVTNLFMPLWERALGDHIGLVEINNKCEGDERLRNILIQYEKTSMEE